jgi:tetratricopeptide (TPR) repeat protein
LNTEKTMKCPRCGITNGKTNRFCRGCGLKLEGLTQQEPKSTTAAEPVKDEVALGEQLYEVWQIYSQGDLDTALTRVQTILQQAPDSSSAHSLLALIYERKAEDLLRQGKVDEARDMLKSAVAEYEKIIDLNPDSVADREKLAALRMKLAVPEGAPIPAAPRDIRARVSAILEVLPKPVWIAFVTFLVVLFVAIIAWPGANERRDREEKLKAAKERHAATASVSVVPQTPTLRVYTFPAAPTASLTGPVTGTPESSAGRAVPSSIAAEPTKVPPLPLPKVKVVPESKESEAKKTQTESKPAAKPEESAASKPSVTEEAPSNRPDGDTALRKAVELRRQGRHQEALAAAEEAARLYQAEIDAGRNVSAAQLGLQTAQALIEASKQALSGSNQPR